MSNVNIVELSGGSRVPLFAIHAAGGVVSLGRLARALDRDQPLYLVKGEGVDTADHSFEDLNDLADHYVTEILKFYPKGPYLLCGRETYSMIEVGQRLLSSGKDVPATIVFDTAPPAVNPFVTRPPRIHSNSVRDVVLRSYSLLRKRLSDLLGSDRGQSMRQRFENGTLTIAGMKVDRNDSPSMANRKMGVKQWQEHYTAKIVYMQSEAYAHDVKRSLHVDRWRAFAEEVEVHVTPGTHSTMFEKPNVAILAHLVCAACGKATESA